MPFTVEQFFEVFRRYNDAVFPAQLVLLGLALAAIILARRGNPSHARPVSAILAILWIWMGVAYHLTFFQEINPAASVFGGLFVLQAGLFLWMGVHRRRLSFTRRTGLAAVAGTALLAYALVIYPLAGYVAGHRYPATPTFGLPCPTVIFTLGMLLWTSPMAPRALYVIPLLWTVIGTGAALQLGVPQDFGLLLAFVVSAPVLFRRAAPDREMARVG
jgi:hypothetical protein